MASTHDLAALNAVGKELYDGQKIAEMFLFKNPALALIEKKTDTTGEVYPIPVIVSGPQGTSNTFANALANSHAAVTRRFNLTRGKVREARSNVESAREEQRKLRLAIGLEVEQARLALQTAEERLGVTGQVVTQASESTSLTRSRFEQGLALATQLIDAETALVTARVRRAEAESDRQIAIAALRKSLGMSQLDPSPIAQKK